MNVIVAASPLLPFAVAVAVALAWLVLVIRPMLERERAREGGSASARRRRAAKPVEAYIQMVGLVVVGLLWYFTGRSGLALAVLAIWSAVTLLMRMRRTAGARVTEETEALDAIASASRILRAGIPVSGMLSILAAESKGETGAAFRELERRESLGEELDSAVRRVLVASPVAPLRAFGLSLLVHLEAGGNLAESADRLSRMLIERGRVRRRARTLTSYGRSAATLLALMPFVIVLLMSVMIEGYADFVFKRPIGNLILSLAAVFVMVGVLAIQRISAVDDASRGAVA